MATENDNPPKDAARNRRSSRSDGSAGLYAVRDVYLGLVIAAVVLCATVITLGVIFR